MRPMTTLRPFAAAAGLALLLSSCGGADAAPPEAPAPTAEESSSADSPSEDAAPPTDESTDDVAAGPTSDESADPPAHGAGPDEESINGRWCPVPVDEASPDPADPASGCVTIDFPVATYDGGAEIEITGPEKPTDQAQYDQVGAPFGVYYAAGTPIEPEVLEMYDDLIDNHDIERIFNSQTGVILVRE